MGQVLALLPALTSALNCEACAKYVCNSLNLHSQCSECCEFDVETHSISISSSSSSSSSDGNCCF